MSENQPAQLHLPDLSIRNFRGIQDLSIKKLGRVTLIAGRNGVGKTSVLEAVRVYAARGRHDIFEELLRKRYEYVSNHAGNYDPVLDYMTLFFGRDASLDQTISIGPSREQDQLRIEMTDAEELSSIQLDLFSEIAHLDSNIKALRITIHGSKSMIPCFLELPDFPEAESFRRVPRRLRKRMLGDSDLPHPIACESLGPGLPGSSMLARFWDNVVFTDLESLALMAIRLTDTQIERVAAIGESNGRFHGGGRRIVVKSDNFPKQIPLSSLGDGIMRLFAAALALAHSRNGFLVIDEVENGIHYSALKGFWEMMLEAAEKYNVQVFATTHSFDCVRAFARAAVDNENADGTLVRLDKKDGQLRTVEYSEKHLEIAADQDIEVR